MNGTLEAALSAHGGKAAWDAKRRLSVTIRGGGIFWGMKGIQMDAAPRFVDIELRRQFATLEPFGNPDWHMIFTSQRVSVETRNGELIADRPDPREAFAGHVKTTHWDPLHLAYFNGYALWTYLSTPFLLTLPGVTVEDIDPLTEGGETWRGIRAHFPAAIATHSAQQDFYFGPDGLVRRHDYTLEVAGGFQAAHLMSDIIDVQGLKFPTKRRAYTRMADGSPNFDELMVSIDLSEYALS
jgi:hypothetical protein